MSMKLTEYLRYIGFELVESKVDDPGELCHREKLVEERRICLSSEADISKPMFRLKDVSGGINLGDIEGDRFSDDEHLVTSIVDRLEDYARDWFGVDYRDFCDANGINTAGMTDEEMVTKANAKGFAARHPYIAEFAEAYLHPETIIRDGVAERRK